MRDFHLDRMTETTLSRAVAVRACAVLLLAFLGSLPVMGQDLPPLKQEFGAAELPTSLRDILPDQLSKHILFEANHESGTLDEWSRPKAKYPGGGVLNTGPENEILATASQEVAFTGSYSAKAKIVGAFRGKAKRAVRLMRWTDKPWDEKGDYFPKQAFYSTWMFVPEKYNSNKYAPWDPGDGGWWNIFQFKANDENEESIPVWALNLYFSDERQQMEIGLYSQINTPNYFGPQEPVAVPVGRWIHLEVGYNVSATGSGSVEVWQDSVRIITASQVKTAVTPKNENAVWGLGNYTDHVDGGEAPGSSVLYFDDAIVSKVAIHDALFKSAWVLQRIESARRIDR